MTIGERIRKIREHLGISQVDFANLINVSKQTLYKYENNIITNIPSDKIEQIAETVKVSPAYIMGWECSIQCPICHNMYDPLNKYDSAEHDAFHQKFVKAQSKYSQILSYEDADKKRSECIHQLNNPTLSKNDRISAFENYLKYEFMLSIWQNHFSLDHEDFSTFCKKEMGLAGIKEVLDNIDSDTYQMLINKYGIADETEYHKINPFSSLDNRDIKRDLDSMIEKLSYQKYGSVIYAGENIPKEDQEFFAGQLELMERKLKMLTKEKNISNNVISLIKEDEPDYLAPNAAHERTNIEYTEEERVEDDSMLD